MKVIAHEYLKINTINTGKPRLKVLINLIK